MTVDVHLDLVRADFRLSFEATIPARGVTALFGPSGCGKTTVLRAIAGLEALAGGRVVVGGDVWQDGKRILPPHRRPVGYVFQEPSLFAHFSVRGNLEYGYKRVPVGERRISFDDAVGALGVEPLLERRSESLSGGERQRVAIARALLTSPRLMLMDEPLSALDRAAKGTIVPMLESLLAGLDIPVLYVSHDIAEVERLADHMVLMEGGRALAAGSLAGLLVDSALPLAKAPEAASIVPATIEGYDPHYALTAFAIDGGRIVVPGRAGKPGVRRRLRIAANDVSLARERPSRTTILNVLHARIESISPLDEARVNIVLRLGEEEGTGDGRLLARITRRSRDAFDFQPGQAVFAQVKSVSLVDPAIR